MAGGSAGKPAWRSAFDKVERAIGVPLEDAVASPAYVDLMTTGIRVRRAVTGVVGGIVGSVTGTALRAANVPTRDDVRRLSSQLAVLASEVRAIRLEQQDRDALPSESAPATGQLGGTDADTRRPGSSGIGWPE